MTCAVAALVAGLLGTCLTFPAAPAAGAPAAGDGSITWGVAPDQTSGGQERANFAYTLDPGGSVRDAIVLTNRSSAPLDLEVYARDALTTLDGHLDLQPAAEQPVDLGSWITVEDPMVHVEPGESATVAFTVEVPATATPGDHGGGIVTSLAEAGSEGTVAVDRRLALRAFVRVGGELAPRVVVSEVSVEAASPLNPFVASTARVRAVIANTGNARVVPTVAVEVRGPFGWLPSRLDAEVGEEILPGSTVAMEFEIPHVRLLGRLGATVGVTAQAVGMGGTGLDVSARGSAATWAVPWSPLGAVVLVALAAWWVPRWWRERHRRRARRSPAPGDSHGETES
ncbi:MAG: DUF916 domain-containing protein [Bifidobacteriaceae bacterium]|jgi:hypothetical protein|nr:DUF916 domain-containing protein [Bifidobacteriaceae bacterium]